MTNKEKIQILKQYLENEKEYNQLVQILQTLKEKMYSVSAQQYTDMPKTLSTTNDKFDNYLINIENYNERINILLDKLNKNRMYIENCINLLENTNQRMVMRYRYLEGYRWEKICIQMNYGWRQTHRIHTNALNNIKLMRSI